MILKKEERLNYTSFALKVSDGEDTEYDKDQIELLAKSLRRMSRTRREMKRRKPIRRSG